MARDQNWTLGGAFAKTVEDSDYGRRAREPEIDPMAVVTTLEAQTAKTMGDQ